MELLDLLFADLSNAFRSISSDDMSYPLSIIAWVTMLGLPLSGVDRRDHITFFTYLAWLLASAVLLFIVVPAKTQGHIPDLGNSFLMAIFMSVVILIRWFIFNQARKQMMKGAIEHGEKK